VHLEGLLLTGLLSRLLRIRLGRSLTGVGGTRVRVLLLTGARVLVPRVGVAGVLLALILSTRILCAGVRVPLLLSWVLLRILAGPARDIAGVQGSGAAEWRLFRLVVRVHGSSFHEEE
jgi:hypothetical protein